MKYKSGTDEFFELFLIIGTSASAAIIFSLFVFGLFWSVFGIVAYITFGICAIMQFSLMLHNRLRNTIIASSAAQYSMLHDLITCNEQKKGGNKKR